MFARAVFRCQIGCKVTQNKKNEKENKAFLLSIKKN